MKKGKTTPPHCSFCGGSEEDVDILISGLEAQICDACAERALEMVDHHLGSDHRRRESSLLLVVQSHFRAPST